MKRFLILAAALCGTGSALAFDSNVVFNEIQYQPAAGQSEWIEVRNLNGVDVNIAGWRISGGVDYTFPATGIGSTIPGHGYLLIAATPSLVPGALGPFTGSLSNSGETLRIRNLSGRIVDELSYEDSGDWPMGADGSGATLARRDRAGAAEGAAAWTASAQIGGTAGERNFVTTPVTRSHISTSTAWKYLDANAAPPADWAAPAFVDSPWNTGNAPLGAQPAGGSGLTVTTNLVARYRAGAIAGLTTGATVTSWQDTATGDGVSQNGSAGATTPTYRANATPNGKPAVRFDGNDESRTTVSPGIPASAGWAYFAVLKGNGAQPAGSYVFDRSTAGTPLASLQSQNGIFALQKRFDDSSGLGGPAATTPISTTSWQTTAIRRNRTQNRFEIWVNGVLQGTETDTGGALTPDPINIGRHSIGTTQGFNGDLAELLIYRDGLTDSEFQQVGTYLNNEYGLLAATALSPTAPVAYLRKTFTFSGDPARTTLRLNHTVADGAVFYLNGMEILRVNLPAGPVGHDTAALSAVASPPTSGFLPVPSGALVTGNNVLAVSLHKAAGSTLSSFDAALESVEQPIDATGNPLRFSEMSGSGAAEFFVELRNASKAVLNTAGWTLRTSTGLTAALPSMAIPAGGLISLDPASLGFDPVNGLKLFLVAPGGVGLSDAREITNRLRGVVDGGRWGYPTTATPGAANVAVVPTDIVINEIFYNAMNGGPAQWIELHNKGTAARDLSGWQFSAGVDYLFPASTVVPAGGYLVVAWDPAAFAVLHPTVQALGPWSGSLSGRGETIILRDGNDNVADEVTYAESGRWSQWADGGGSSLELRDPDSDNSRGEAWAGSDESGQSTWQTVSYSGVGANPNLTSSDPTTWNEFVFGLLNDGEFLIDDISVTVGTTPLIQNGNFNGGNAAFWRIIGNHAGTVMQEPPGSGNFVLKVAASGATEHMHNHATTTLKAGASYHTLSATSTYNISFRAKWLRGSNRLHTRLYLNRLARQTLLPTPARSGTPGAVNRSAVANAGPTFDGLIHAPAVPAVSENAVVSVSVQDPDGLAAVELFTSVSGAAFTATPMTDDGSGRFSATVPGRREGTLAQFYVRATDLPGAAAFFPADGPASRAMMQWQDGKAIIQTPSRARPHNVRILMTGADAANLYRLDNVMSNGSLPCTVIYDEQEIHYRASARLKSSEHGRFNESRVGFNLQFAGDELFLGVHAAVSVDRSGGTSAGQREILIKTVTNAAGGINAPEDDLIRVIAPVATGVTPGTGWNYNGTTLTGPAILSKTRFDDTYLDGQWDNGSDGPIFKYERVYVLTQTMNPVTRVTDSSIVPENPKIPQDSTGPPGVAVRSLGTDKETYRWYWLIENARNNDDYQKIINVAGAIGQTSGSAAFKTQTEQFLDVDALLRAHVPAILYGVVDNYLTASAQHNVLFYFPPGGKCVIFPWDLDFLNQGNATASLTSGQDLGKFITDPANRRLYYGHMLDILNRSFNDAFMTRWATHYSTFGTDDMTASLTYLRSRATFARSVVTGTNGQIAPVPNTAFIRTSAASMSVTTPFATITGDGWIDIAFIRLGGSPEPLAVTWTDDNSWSLQLPLFKGTRTYPLEAVRRDGTPAGTATVTVTSTGGIVPAAADNLVFSKIHYHPADPTAAETTAGYTTADDFEYLELQNISPDTVELRNCRFDSGLTYTFGVSTQIPPGGRLILPRRTAAFALRHPGVPTAPQYFIADDPAGNRLSDGGEMLGLLSAAGPDVKRFSYDDAAPWPTAADGGGSSLTLISPIANPDHSDPLSWKASSSAGGSPGSLDGMVFSGDPNADSDMDGLPDLVEFAIGTGSPPFASFTGLPASPLIWFTVDRDTTAQISTTVQISTDPAAPSGWTAAPAGSLVSRTPVLDTVERLVFAIPTAPGTPRTFIRARFSSP